jgi:cysteine desulfurase/selenocysteine lyase
VPALGVDFYAFSGHKVFGPNGVRVLWGRRDRLAALPPFQGGGGAVETVTLEAVRFLVPPQRFEAGTPPIAPAVGLGAALSWYRALDNAAVKAHVRRLVGLALDGLTRVNALRLVGPRGLDNRLGVVSFVIDGVHPHDVAQVLDAHGVCVRAGHNCAQPLMARFGIVGTTRASFALYSTDADVDALVAGVADAVKRLA